MIYLKQARTDFILTSCFVGIKVKNRGKETILKGIVGKDVDSSDSGNRELNIFYKQI